jgi:aromatic ring-opening dioxygenase LigB subunit
VPTEEPFQGKINSQVAAVGLDDDDAKAYSEFVEHLTDDGHNSELVVIAPHGGDIEEHTGEQAEEVAKQLSSKSVSVWICKGYKKGKEDPDNLKKEIKKAIYDVVSGSGIVVEIAGDDDNNAYVRKALTVIPRITL